MDAQLVQRLIAMGQQVAPHNLPPTNPPTVQWVASLMREMPNYSRLVLVGDAPQITGEHLAHYLETWVRSYHNIYVGLTSVLFPSSQRSAHTYFDSKRPAIIYITAESSVVLREISKTVYPYITSRQQTGGATIPEINGVIDQVLQDLAADDLDRAVYRDLKHYCVQQVYDVLAGSIVQEEIMGFNNAYPPVGPQHTIPHQPGPAPPDEGGIPRIEEPPKPDTLPGLGPTGKRETSELPPLNDQGTCTVANMLADNPQNGTGRTAPLLPLRKNRKDKREDEEDDSNH